MTAPTAEPMSTTSQRAGLMPTLCWNSSLISPMAKPALGAAGYGVSHADVRLLQVGHPGEDRPEYVEGDKNGGGGAKAIDRHGESVRPERGARRPPAGLIGWPPDGFARRRCDDRTSFFRMMPGDDLAVTLRLWAERGEPRGGY